MKKGTKEEKEDTILDRLKARIEEWRQGILGVSWLIFMAIILLLQSSRVSSYNDFSLINAANDEAQSNTLDLKKGFFNLTGDDTTIHMITFGNERASYYSIGHKEYARFVALQLRGMNIETFNETLNNPNSLLNDYFARLAIAKKNHESGLIIMAILYLLLLSGMTLRVPLPRIILVSAIACVSLAAVNIYCVINNGNLATSLINLSIGIGCCLLLLLMFWIGKQRAGDRV